MIRLRLGRIVETALVLQPVIPCAADLPAAVE